jgi:hypothetical protein
MPHAQQFEFAQLRCPRSLPAGGFRTVDCSGWLTAGATGTGRGAGRRSAASTISSSSPAQSGSTQQKSGHLLANSA